MSIVGGGLALLGLGLAIKGFNSNSKYRILLCVVGAFLAGKGMAFLGLF